MLQFKSFLPANDKVKQVEFHPTQPWVAVVSKANTVSVWDWNSLKIVQEFQMGGYDDEALMEMNLAKMGEKDPSIGRAPNSLLSHASKQQSGGVKQVKFFDADVAYYQHSSAHYSVVGTTAPVPDSPAIQSLGTHRLIVMACDNKVVVMDLVSRRCQELPRPALDGKAATCLAFLLPQPRHAALLPSAGASPLLAIGLSDGSARIVHLATLKVLTKLAPGHKASLAHLLVVPGGKAASAGDTLVGGDASGNLILWEPLSRPMGLAEQHLAPRTVISAHDKEISSLCLGYAGEDLDKAHPRVFTTGVDNRVAFWDPATWAEVHRVKLDNKTPVAGVAFSARNLTSIGSHNLTLATGTPVVFAMHAASGASRHVCNLNGIVPPGTKKVPKIYCVAAHATQPQMVVLGANTGAAICAYDTLYIPPIAPLPSTSAGALVDPLGEALGGGTSLTYACVLGSKISTATVSAVTQEVEGSTQISTRVVEQGRVAEAGQAGKAFVSTSHDGQYLSVAWPLSRTYSIYHRSGPNSWQEVDKGAGACVAWCSHKLRYAVLEEPQLAGAMPEAAPRRGLGRKAKGPDPAAVRAAMDAASAAAAANTRIKIKEVSGGVARMVTAEMQLRGDTPLYVHGGALLGVAYRRTVGDVEPLADRPLQALQFFDWDGTSRVGGELLEPMWMAWDPHHQYCALAYPTQLLLCSLRPSFQALAALPLPAAQSAAWGTRQLFVSTPTSVVAIFVVLQPPPLAPLAGATDTTSNKPTFQVVPLAAVDVTEDSAPESGSVKLGGLPQVVRRPPGPLVVLGAGGGHLWLANTQGQAVPLSLSHPGMQVRSRAASGDLEGARLVADMRIHPHHHDDMAAFLTCLGGRAGAQTALGLTGLTLKTDIEISIRAGQWERVVTGCRALLAGCSYRPPASQTATAGLAAPTPLGPSGLVPPPAAPIIPPAPGTVPAGQTGVPPMDPAMALALLAQLHGANMQPQHSSKLSIDVAPPLDDVAPANIDWDAPIRQALTQRARASALARAPHGPPTASSASDSGAATAIDPAAVDTVLQAADAALSAGMRDAAQRVVGLLLEQAAQLPDSRAGRVALRAQEAGLGQKLSQLHTRRAAFATSTDESAGLFAAAVSGGPEVLHAALRQGAAVALGALQGSNYRLPGAMEEESLWNTHLQATGGFGNTRGLRFQVSQY